MVERHGQEYTLFSIDPYTNGAGEEISLFKLLSCCRVCRSTFSVRVALSTVYWNVRCPGCIRKGHRA